jgi:hypothetical protein
VKEKETGRDMWPVSFLVRLGPLNLIELCLGYLSNLFDQVLVKNLSFSVTDYIFWGGLLLLLYNGKLEGNKN